MNPIEIFKGTKFEKAIGYMINNTDKLPYLVYLGTGAELFKADDTNYKKAYNYDIEYYFNKKNEKTEQDIENILDSKNIPWTKSEDIYIKDEHMYMIVYSI